MAAEEDAERKRVQTVVPAYQRERWREHADRMDMSLSEFVRTMVQAGIRDFSLDGDDSSTEEPHVPDATPRGEDLKGRVLELLREEGAQSWEELLDSVTGDIENRLDDVLTELQQEDRVTHSGRDGGYVVIADE